MPLAKENDTKVDANDPKPVSIVDNTKLLMDLAKNLSERKDSSVNNFDSQKPGNIHQPNITTPVKAPPKIVSVTEVNYPRQIFEKKFVNSTVSSTITSNCLSSEPTLSDQNDPTYEPSEASINQTIEKKIETSIDETSEAVENELSFGKSKLGMIVPKSSTNTKQYPCCFCKKLVSKLARHLETVHKSEESVKQSAVFKPKHPERIKIIELLRNQGMKEYNKTSTDNIMITARRQRKDKNRDAFAYVPCSKCSEVVLKNNIRHHKCVAEKSEKNGKKIISRVIEGVRLECRMSESASKLLREKVIYYMNDDSVTATAVHDESIVKYGNFLCDKYQLHQLKKMIAARMKLLARVLIQARKYDGTITDFESLLHTTQYQKLEKAIFAIGGYDEMKKTFDSPANVTHLATLVRQLAETVKMDHTIKQNNEQVRQIELFLSVFNQLFNSKAAELVE